MYELKDPAIPSKQMVWALLFFIQSRREQWQSFGRDMSDMATVARSSLENDYVFRIGTTRNFLGKQELAPTPEHLVEHDAAIAP